MLTTIILLRFTPLASPLLRAGFSTSPNNHLLFLFLLKICYNFIISSKVSVNQDSWACAKQGDYLYMASAIYLFCCCSWGNPSSAFLRGFMASLRKYPVIRTLAAAWAFNHNQTPSEAWGKKDRNSPRHQKKNNKRELLIRREFFPRPPDRAILMAIANWKRKRKRGGNH